MAADSDVKRSLILDSRPHINTMCREKMKEEKACMTSLFHFRNENMKDIFIAIF